MAKRVFQSSLSVKGIENLIKQLRDYQNQLNRKTEQLVKKLAEAGIPVIDSNMAKATFTVDSKGIQSGSDPEHYTYVKINTFDDYAEATLIVEGNELLFIEFGSGVYHNTPVGTSPNPKGGELGYVIGSYGQGHGVQKVWGYYDDDGNLILTHGTEATMPIYKAGLEIREKFLRIAREVFEK